MTEANRLSNLMHIGLNLLPSPPYMLQD